MFWEQIDIDFRIYSHEFIIVHKEIQSENISLAGLGGEQGLNLPV